MKSIEDHLIDTSRTFAISIPFLAEPLRTQVGVAYLLFRIADTFEDSFVWPVARKRAYLRAFREALHGNENTEMLSLNETLDHDPPCVNEKEISLLKDVPGVLSVYNNFPEGIREIIRTDVSRTIDGMERHVARADANGNVELCNLDELREYCYIVAGIVGEMLTSMFLYYFPELHKQKETLYSHAKSFGEGLQLVNILKDAMTDREEGRQFLPSDTRINHVHKLAREDLKRAEEYVELVSQIPQRKEVVGFLLMPLFLAWATMEILERGIGQNKVNRQDVIMLHDLLAEHLRGNDQMPPRKLFIRIARTIQKSRA